MTSRIIVFIVIALIIGGILGYALGARGIGQMATTNTITSSDDSNPLLTNRSASANGKITKFENNRITLTNDNGESADFNLVENALVFRLNNNGLIGSPSADLQDITLDQPVGVNLTYVDGEYRVASITYTPNLTPPPLRNNPAASDSAITAPSN